MSCKKFDTQQFEIKYIDRGNPENEHHIFLPGPVLPAPAEPVEECCFVLLTRR